MKQVIFLFLALFIGLQSFSQVKKKSTAGAHPKPVPSLAPIKYPIVVKNTCPVKFPYAIKMSKHAYYAGFDYGNTNQLLAGKYGQEVLFPDSASAVTFLKNAEGYTWKWEMTNNVDTIMKNEVDTARKCRYK